MVLISGGSCSLSVALPLKNYLMTALDVYKCLESVKIWITLHKRALPSNLRPLCCTRSNLTPIAMGMPVKRIFAERAKNTYGCPCPLPLNWFFKE